MWSSFKLLEVNNMATFKTRADVADSGSLTVVGLPCKLSEKVVFAMDPIEKVQEEKAPIPTARQAPQVRPSFFESRLTIGSS